MLRTLAFYLLALASVHAAEKPNILSEWGQRSRVHIMPAISINRSQEISHPLFTESIPAHPLDPSNLGSVSDKGIICAAARVRRIMEEPGLRAIQPRTYVPKTSDGRADKPSPNLLLEKPLPGQPDQVWAGDITYIPTADGWRYLAVIIDLCSRRIVGWALADHMRIELVTDALKQALRSRTVAPGLIFHSGSQ